MSLEAGLSTHGSHDCSTPAPTSPKRRSRTIPAWTRITLHYLGLYQRPGRFSSTLENLWNTSNRRKTTRSLGMAARALPAVRDTCWAAEPVESPFPVETPRTITGMTLDHGPRDKTDACFAPRTMGEGEAVSQLRGLVGADGGGSPLREPWQEAPACAVVRDWRGRGRGGWEGASGRFRASLGLEKPSNRAKGVACSWRLGVFSPGFCR